MIGGSDFVIPTHAAESAFDVCLRIISRHWPAAVFEDALSDGNVEQFNAVPIGQWTELFAYRDATAASGWDEHGAIPELAGTMIHLTRSAETVTVTVDDVPGPEIRGMVEEMRHAVQMDILTLQASDTMTRQAIVTGVAA